MLADELFAIDRAFDDSTIIIHVWDVARSPELQRQASRSTLEPAEQSEAPYRRVQTADGRLMVPSPGTSMNVSDLQVKCQFLKALDREFEFQT